MSSTISFGASHTGCYPLGGYSKGWTADTYDADRSYYFTSNSQEYQRYTASSSSDITIGNGATGTKLLKIL